MEFLFTENNKVLQDMEKEWLAGCKFGAYMLVGKSGSGKTAFLRQLDADWQKQQQEKMITWLTTEYVVDALLHDKDIFKELKTPVVIVENMEELKGKDSTITYVFDWIHSWLKQNKGLFIGTAIDNTIAFPEYVTVLENKEIEITPQVVEVVAKMKNLQLDKERVSLITQKAEGRMTNLFGLLHREILT
ncbi:MAG: DnaA/Hda family protein [Clostridiales bacterium]|nr:DnaA/Hda family protein [Clostridiales bacterium]